MSLCKDDTNLLSPVPNSQRSVHLDMIIDTFQAPSSDGTAQLERGFLGNRAQALLIVLNPGTLGPGDLRKCVCLAAI